MKKRLMIAITVSAFLGILSDTIVHVFVEPSLALTIILFINYDQENSFFNNVENIISGG